jgi:hypothetical protein
LHPAWTREGNMLSMTTTIPLVLGLLLVAGVLPLQVLSLSH